MSKPEIDLSDLAHHARHAAKIASGVAMTHFRNRLNIGYKSDESPVAQADRVVEIAVRDYYCEARPQGWMFPGRNRVDPMSTRQFNRAFGVACDFAEIRKQVSPHTSCRRRASGTMRHSFATYLLEGGTTTA